MIIIIKKEAISVEELLDLKDRMERERPTPWAELPDLALYMDQIIA